MKTVFRTRIQDMIYMYVGFLAGAVLLDGRNIRTIPVDWLRDQIGLVNQEPTLFATSIKENILYGKKDASDAEIEEATKLSNAHSFIVKLPEGYNTQVLRTSPPNCNFFIIKFVSFQGL